MMVFLFLPSIDLSIDVYMWVHMYTSILTHSYYDTNITLFPYWEAGPRD